MLPPGNMAISSSRERDGIVTMTSVQSHKVTYEEMPTVAKRTKKKKKKMEEIQNEREDDFKDTEMKYLRHIQDEINSPQMTKKLYEHYAEKSIQHAKKRLVETVRAKEKRTFFDKDLINNFTAAENSKIGNKSVKKLKSEYFDKYLIRLSSFAIKKMIQTELNNSLKGIDQEKKKKGIKLFQNIGFPKKKLSLINLGSNQFDRNQHVVVISKKLIGLPNLKTQVSVISVTSSVSNEEENPLLINEKMAQVSEPLTRPSNQQISSGNQPINSANQQLNSVKQQFNRSGSFPVFLKKKTQERATFIVSDTQLRGDKLQQIEDCEDDLSLDNEHMIRVQKFKRKKRSIKKKKTLKTKKMFSTNYYTQRENEDNFNYLDYEAKELEERIRHQKVINEFCNKFF